MLVDDFAAALPYMPPVPLIHVHKVSWLTYLAQNGGSGVPPRGYFYLPGLTGIPATLGLIEASNLEPLPDYLSLTSLFSHHVTTLGTLLAQT